MKQRVQGKNILVSATGKALVALAGERNQVHLKTGAINVRDSGVLEICVQKVGRLERLFNCAGFEHSGNVLGCKEVDRDFSTDPNVKSMHRTIHAILLAVLEHGGSIISGASAASNVNGVLIRFVYERRMRSLG